MKLDAIYGLIAADMAAVDEVIRQRLKSDVVLINQVAEYIITSGGKRMRPALVLLAAGACGSRDPLQHSIAAVVEFIHTATLLHDDVVDDSSLRRGRDTANALFGNAASVLVGDFLYSRAFQMMVVSNNPRIMEVMADTTNAIAAGEVMQLMNCHNPDISIQQYLEVIARKTAKLFAAAARLGAIVGQAPAEAEECLSRYGMHLGAAFQIIDDVLDYSGEEAQTGKHLGDDLAEGKPTLPLIHAMLHGNQQQTDCVREAIRTGERALLGEVIKALHATGALGAASAIAQKEAVAACQAIESLPASEYHQALLEFARFAAQRKH